MLGYVPDRDLPPLYSEAIAYVFPSLYEGFGLPVLEAMACGCPVVVPRAHSMPELVGEAGAYFGAPTDVDQLERCLLDIVDSEKARKEMSAAGLLTGKAVRLEGHRESDIGSFREEPRCAAVIRPVRRVRRYGRSRRFAQRTVPR